MTTPVNTAITLTVAELMAEVGGTQAQVERWYEVAVNMVEEYAPKSPSANKAEAILRFGGYLRDADPGTQRSQSFGPKSIDFVTNHAAMFRNSGSAALLTRWKRRRGGKV